MRAEKAEKSLAEKIDKIDFLQKHFKVNYNSLFLKNLLKFRKF